ncbi:MAG TPA: hypothetical protein PK366_09255 [Fibrobacteraceae bacterium]|nr:hypothetical protein [Fibrobacteraceae bacterium]
MPSNLLGSEKIQISFDEIEENRRWWPHFRDRRIDLYSDILKIWDTP